MLEKKLAEPRGRDADCKAEGEDGADRGAANKVKPRRNRRAKLLLDLL
jgi:hypothetical protein